MNEEIINVKKQQLRSLKKSENEINKIENNENNKQVNENDETDETDENNEENSEFDNNESSNENLDWKEYHEKILIDWADKAQCYQWLHSKSANKYIRLRNLYTIPVIVLSTLTGTANFALERVPQEYQGYCQVAIGSLNIIAGIITTVSQFLKINELSEAHRVSSMSWDKFYRNIRVELIKAPEDRTDVNYLIKSCKDEYGRLMEISPNIDEKIVKMFMKTFKLNKTATKISNQNSLKSISKPEILDSLESTKNVVYKIDPNFKINQNNIKQNKEQKNKELIISNFVDTFKNEYSRKPSIIEIYDNLDNKISKDVLEKYLENNK